MTVHGNKQKKFCVGLSKWLLKKMTARRIKGGELTKMSVK